MILARLSTVERPFKICLSGGEPTLNPYLTEIIDKLASMPFCQNIALMTNLSRNILYYENIKDIGDRYEKNSMGLSKIVIMSSYHPEYFDDKFLKKAIHLSKVIKRFQVSVNLLDNPTTWETSKNIIDNLIEYKVKVKPTVLASNNNWKSNYTDEFYKIFSPYLISAPSINYVDILFITGEKTRMKDFEIEHKGYNQFKGYRCTPVFYNIDVLGKIRNSCTNKEVGLSLNDKNTVKEEICPHNVCPGRQMFQFYKEKI
jgi:organic radical activating enzyme